MQICVQDDRGEGIGRGESVSAVIGDLIQTVQMLRGRVAQMEKERQADVEAIAGEDIRSVIHRALMMVSPDKPLTVRHNDHVLIVHSGADPRELLQAWLAQQNPAFRSRL